MDSEAVLILRANVAYARIRAGQVSRAADLIGADESLDIDRWPVHYVRAVIDMLEGNARAGVKRVDLLWREVGPVDQVDLESLCTVSDIHFWAGSPRHTLPRLLHDLDQVVDSAPIRMLAPALVAAARASAEPPRVPGPDVAPPPAAASVSVHALLSRAWVGRRESDERDPHITAQVTTAAAELARATGDDGIAGWVGCRHRVGPDRSPARRGVLPLARSAGGAARGPGDRRPTAPRARRRRRARARPPTPGDQRHRRRWTLTARPGDLVRVLRPATRAAGAGRPTPTDSPRVHPPVLTP